MKVRHILFFTCLSLWAFLLSGLFHSASAQTDGTKGAASFSLEVSSNEHGIFMTCVEGCQFEVVKLDMREYQPRYISANGLSMEKDEVMKSESPFVFSILKAGDSFEMKRLRGTAWTNLSFDCGPSGCRADIDQNGVRTW